MLETELLSAARQGNAPEVSALLNRGAKVDARDESGATALLIATHENNIGGCAGAYCGRRRRQCQGPD